MNRHISYYNYYLILYYNYIILYHRNFKWGTYIRTEYCGLLFKCWKHSRKKLAQFSSVGNIVGSRVGLLIESGKYCGKYKNIKKKNKYIIV